MIRTTVTLIIFYFFFCCQTFAQQVGNREIFNRNWTFFLGDNEFAKSESFDDSSWENVGLPHSFSIPYFMSPDFYVGYGWYRKKFDISAQQKKMKIFLEFEGVFQEAEVFVNGKKAGSHQGGYTGFVIDISPNTKIGSNTVAVRVNNKWNAQIAPRAGEHVFSGGIYRDVYLVTSAPVHIAWNGVSVTTPKVDKKSAAIRVATEVVNEFNFSKSIKLATKIFDPQGKLVARVLSERKIEPKETVMLEQYLSNIREPKLWDVGQPNLYSAESQIIERGKILNTVKTTFGIRTIRWDADSGFYLNGKHVYILGANAHQDQAGWGDAVTNDGFSRDVKMIKEAGFNFIRGSHYPHDPAYLEACDKEGIMFWSENAFWGIGGSLNTPDGYWNTSAYPISFKDEEGFGQSVKNQLTEMIRIHRNHPSVVAWSMSNEAFFSANGKIEGVKKLLRECVDLSHKLDPTRPAAIGGSQRPLDSNRIDRLGDISGYNGDGASIQIFQKPGKASIISEYGSTTADRPGEYQPGWGDLSKDKGEPLYSWRSGQAIWSAFDHGSIAGSTLGKMGIVDYFRIPKRAWYWYRNAYRKITPPEWPVVGKPYALRLQADKTNVQNTDGTDDVFLKVTVVDSGGKVLSNSPTVTLKVISGPGIFPTGRQIIFSEKSDVRILDGQAAISFRSYHAGETLIEASADGLISGSFKINFMTGPKFSKMNLSQIKDKKYERYIAKEKPNSPKIFGLNNPTFASSSKRGYSPGLAADGDAKTFWQPLEDDLAPNWTLDMERKVIIRKIALTFNNLPSNTFRIETSNDRMNWRSLADRDSSAFKELTLTINVPSGVAGRYVRVVFANEKLVNISECMVTGYPEL